MKKVIMGLIILFYSAEVCAAQVVSLRQLRNVPSRKLSDRDKKELAAQGFVPVELSDDTRPDQFAADERCLARRMEAQKKWTKLGGPEDFDSDSEPLVVIIKNGIYVEMLEESEGDVGNE